MDTMSARLRQLLQDEKLLMLPGAFDAMTAKLIQLAGFPALFLTGAGVSLSLLAQPDLETVSYLELRNKAEEVLSAACLPCMAVGMKLHGEVRTGMEECPLGTEAQE